MEERVEVEEEEEEGEEERTEGWERLRHPNQSRQKKRYVFDGLGRLGRLIGGFCGSFWVGTRKVCADELVDLDREVDDTVGKGTPVRVVNVWGRKHGLGIKDKDSCILFGQLLGGRRRRRRRVLLVSFRQLEARHRLSVLLESKGQRFHSTDKGSQSRSKITYFASHNNPDQLDQRCVERFQQRERPGRNRSQRVLWQRSSRLDWL